MAQYQPGAVVNVLAYDSSGMIHWRAAVIVDISATVNPVQPTVPMYDIEFTDSDGGTGTFDESHVRLA